MSKGYIVVEQGSGWLTTTTYDFKFESSKRDFEKEDYAKMIVELADQNNSSHCVRMKEGKEVYITIIAIK